MITYYIFNHTQVQSISLTEKLGKTPQLGEDYRSRERPQQQQQHFIAPMTQVKVNLHSFNGYQLPNISRKLNMPGSRIK